MAGSRVVSAEFGEGRRQQNIKGFNCPSYFYRYFSISWHMDKAYNHMLAKKL